MKKVSLLFLLSCMLNVVQPNWMNPTDSIKNYVSPIKNVIPPFDVSKLNLTSIKLPEGFKLPKIYIPKTGSLLKFPSVNNVVKEMKELPNSVILNIKEEVSVFLRKQIRMFENVTLSIYDDFENPVEFKLKLPDFNLFNLFSDINKEVTFRLYTRETGVDKYDILGIDNKTALEKSHFNMSRNTYIITHGFLASGDGLSCTLIRDAILNTTDANIIIVNWSPLSVGDYVIARLFVTRVGPHIGKFINFLYKEGLNPNTLTLIGHSLGAQIMGFAGQTSNEKVKIIIGLDPAWPLFVLLSDEDRLSSDDAQYVEVIHTNGGLLGVPFVAGHYDFYPNGGFYQRGCSKEHFSPCSHGRSYRYLAEEISNPGSDFYAVKCNSYSDFMKHQCSNETAIMGDIKSLPKTPGEYYLQTKDEEPYSRGLIGLISDI